MVAIIPMSNKRVDILTTRASEHQKADSLLKQHVLDKFLNCTVGNIIMWIKTKISYSKLTQNKNHIKFLKFFCILINFKVKTC